MNQFNEFLLFLDSNLSGSWWFPILLVGTGIFFTIYLGFPQFKFFGKAWKLVSGKNTKSDAEGETTAFHKNVININELKDYLRYESI